MLPLYPRRMHMLGWRAVARIFLFLPAFSLTVAFGWHYSVLDALSLILFTHACYTYLITNFGNLAAEDHLVW